MKDNIFGENLIECLVGHITNDAMPGVEAILTADDLPEVEYRTGGPVLKSRIDWKARAEAAEAECARLREAHSAQLKNARELFIESTRANECTLSHYIGQRDAYRDDLAEALRLVHYAECSECGIKYGDEQTTDCVEAHCVEARAAIKKGE